jgi:hypothetical protein
MPIFSTIRQGAFIQSGRLTGTPKGESIEPNVSRLSRALCHECRNWLDLDELEELEDGWYCEECEGKGRRKNMDAKLISEILELHRKWLNGIDGGKRADLIWANLTGADLIWADLHGANLHGANLTEANLTRANLTGANLTEANLTRANLTGANLTGANLTGANLTGANLTGANLTIFPDLFLFRLQPSTAKLRAWKFVRADGGSPIQEDRIIYEVGKSYDIRGGNIDERIHCAPGLNVATLPWCLKRSDKDGDLFIEVEFKAGDILAIPFGTDGKFRVSKLKVIRSMTREDAEAMMREYLKPYGKK